MAITPITNHVQAALARFLQQYKNAPKNYSIYLSASGQTLDVSALDAIVASLVNEVQNIENAANDVAVGQLFYDGTNFIASGAQLDGIGAIVGQPRNGLEDGPYVLFILAKIAENFSNGTTPEILNIAALLFQVTTLLGMPHYPAEFDLQIPNDTPLDPALFEVAAGIIAGALSAGIGLGFISLMPSGPAFQFTRVGGPMVGGGFGSASQPGGGGFAKLIYHDEGV